MRIYDDKSAADPWLTVIIPTYNGAAYINNALGSLLQDGCNGIECLVIDDGSTDSTIEIIKKYISLLDIKFIESERSGNWALNTNIALCQAAADHVCFLHQDDYWLPGRALQIRTMISEYPNCVLYVNSSLFVDCANKVIGGWSCPLPGKPNIVKSKFMLERLIVQDFIAICAPVFKRQQAIKVGGLDASLWYTADWDFWLKLAARGDSIYNPSPLTAFRVHNNSQTIRRSIQSSSFRFQLECVLERHFALNPWISSLRIRVAHASVEINIFLACLYHGMRPEYFKVFSGFIFLGPIGWWIYFRDSRINQRIFARLKAGILK